MLNLLYLTIIHEKSRLHGLPSTSGLKVTKGRGCSVPLLRQAVQGGRLLSTFAILEAKAHRQHDVGKTA
jgi:hypothetical protein